MFAYLPLRPIGFQNWSSIVALAQRSVMPSRFPRSFNGMNGCSVQTAHKLHQSSKSHTVIQIPQLLSAFFVSANGWVWLGWRWRYDILCRASMCDTDRTSTPLATTSNGGRRHVCIRKAISRRDLKGAVVSLIRTRRPSVSLDWSRTLSLDNRRCAGPILQLTIDAVRHLAVTAETFHLAEDAVSHANATRETEHDALRRASRDFVETTTTSTDSTYKQSVLRATRLSYFSVSSAVHLDDNRKSTVHPCCRVCSERGSPHRRSGHDRDRDSHDRYHDRR